MVWQYFCSFFSFGIISQVCKHFLILFQILAHFLQFWCTLSTFGTLSQVFAYFLNFWHIFSCFVTFFLITWQYLEQICANELASHLGHICVLCCHETGPKPILFKWCTLNTYAVMKKALNWLFLVHWGWVTTLT